MDVAFRSRGALRHIMKGHTMSEQGQPKPAAEQETERKRQQFIEEHGREPTPEELAALDVADEA